MSSTHTHFQHGPATVPVRSSNKIKTVFYQPTWVCFGILQDKELGREGRRRRIVGEGIWGREQPLKNQCLRGN